MACNTEYFTVTFVLMNCFLNFDQTEAWGFLIFEYLKYSAVVYSVYASHKHINEFYVQKMGAKSNWEFLYCIWTTGTF